MKGDVDPRYEVEEGRVTPWYYINEVENGRELLLQHLKLQFPSKNISYNLSYCHANKDPTTLETMPVELHESVLNPCHPTASGRKYVERIHAKEFPHVSYAAFIGQSEHKKASINVASLNQNGASNVQFVSDPRMLKYHHHIELPHEMMESEACHQLIREDDIQTRFKQYDQHHDLLNDCLHSVGLTDLREVKNNLFIPKGILCTSNFERYQSCGAQYRKLNVLIVHNHCPLYSRYGSDKRLFHIAKSLFALGHTVSFAGTEISPFETEDDHDRLKSIGAHLYSPIAVRDENSELWVNTGPCTIHCFFLFC